MTTLQSPRPAPGTPAGSGPGASVSAVADRRSAPDAARTLYALLASALGVLPLKALFTDSTWLWDVWIAMAVVIGPAAIMRVWRRASALQTWAGVMLLAPYLTLRFVHQHAIGAVIPGPGTWHDVHELMIGLHNTTAHGVAPVHSTNAIRLVLCVVLPLIAALIDLIAVVGRHGALAGVPLLVIYTVSGAVPRHPVSWPLFVFGAAAFLVLISLDSRDDLQRWGHYVPRTGQATRRAAGAISAQRIAAVAVVLAVIIPAFVQANTHNLIANVFHNDTNASTGDGPGLGSGTGGIDPFAKLRGELTRTNPIDLLTVHVVRLDAGTGTVQPFYARENVLSTYDGQEWTTEGHGALEPLLSSSFQSSPGTPTSPVAVNFRAEITVDKLTSDPPVFVQPTQLSDLTTATQWSPQDQLLIGGATRSNEEYQVQFEQPNPSLEDLNAAVGFDPALAPWLLLPTVAPSVHQLVDRLTANAVTPYEKARAIDTYFTDPANGFGYNLTVPPGKTGDPLVDFLTNKVGFCQQYAAAMGVMMRLAGVPSRVVLGYTHAAPDTDGVFTITTNDAHAWVEGYFDGIGWIPFDPTPLNGITGGKTNDLAWAQHSAPPSSASSSSSAPISGASKPGKGPTSSRSSGATVSTGSSHGSLGVTLPIVGGVIVLLLAGFSAPYLQRSRRRRHRLRAGRGGDVDAVWAELTDTATDLGYAWSPSRTPRQVSEWLAPAMGESKPSLAALSSAVEQARYAPPGSVTLDGPALVSDYEQVQGRLTASRERTVQLRARLLPPSLGWTNRVRSRLDAAMRGPRGWRHRRH